jgi:hypothetical protein
MSDNSNQMEENNSSDENKDNKRKRDNNTLHQESENSSKVAKVSNDTAGYDSNDDLILDQHLKKLENLLLHKRSLIQKLRAENAVMKEDFKKLHQIVNGKEKVDEVVPVARQEEKATDRRTKETFRMHINKPRVYCDLRKIPRMDGMLTESVQSPSPQKRQEVIRHEDEREDSKLSPKSSSVNTSESDRPTQAMFKVGDVVQIAHGIENSAGSTNSEFVPSARDPSIGVMGTVLEIVASNGKSIEVSFNRKINYNLKLLVEIMDVGRTHLPRQVWVKAVDVVNFDLLLWNCDTERIYEVTKDLDLCWKNLLSRINIWHDENLQETLSLIQDQSKKDLQKHTDYLKSESKKLYRAQFYHLVHAQRLRRWQYHVDFVMREYSD